MDASESAETHDRAPRRPAPLRMASASHGFSERALAGLREDAPAEEIEADLSRISEKEKELTDWAHHRLDDRELLDHLRENFFDGPDYESFADGLARYALPVLRAWMYSGYIFVLTAKHSHNLVPSDAELDHLHRDSDLREELAIMTVAKALRFFRDRVLRVDVWVEDGGASLTTFFTGCCVHLFPNEFRQHRRTQKRWREQDASDHRGLITAAADAEDPATVVSAGLWAADCLARYDERTRAIVVLRMDGYSHAEIVEILGETSVRAVEGVLHRLRTSERSRMQRKDER